MDRSSKLPMPGAAARRSLLAACLGVALATAGVESRAQATAPVRTPYVDQLIEGPPPEEEAETRRVGEEPEGVRALAVEYRIDLRHQRDVGTAVDQGLGLALRRETAEYGEFFFDGVLRHYDPLPTEPPGLSLRRGGRATLYQTGLPVTTSFAANNAVGVVRTLPIPLVGNSFRFPLPSSLGAGATSVLYGADRQLSVSATELGRIEGTAGQAYRATSGTLYGAGYMQRVSPTWRIGGQAYSVRGADTVRDHETIAVAAEYSPRASQSHKALVLRDSSGHGGGYLEGDVMLAPVRHRFGLFRFEPGLLWTDVPIVNDQQGGYWRGEYRTIAVSTTAGLDLTESNYRNDPARAGFLAATAYANATYRVDRRLSLGGSVSGTSLSPRGLTPESIRLYSVTGFASHLNALGLTRVDVSRAQSLPERSRRESADSITWNQEWAWAAGGGLSTQLGQSWEERSGDRVTRTIAGVIGRHAFARGGLLDASVVGVYTRSSALGAQRDLNAYLTLAWPFAPNWSLLATVAWTTVDLSPTLMGAPATTFREERRVFFGIRYEETRGQPLQALGGVPGGGTGRLVGVVFFDENGDGRRQPNEPVAPNVTVFLDGRFPATTGPDGRFTFPLVGAGVRAIRVQNEALPLPWTFDDARAPTVEVPVRGEAFVEVPLTRLQH